MALNKSFLTTVVLLACLGYGAAHTMGLGTCPKVEPLKDFNMDKVRFYITFH